MTILRPGSDGRWMSTTDFFYFLTFLSGFVISPFGSISSIFYEQLLHSQITKAQKRQSLFFALSGSAHKKAACRTLMKLNPPHSPVAVQHRLGAIQIICDTLRGGLDSVTKWRGGGLPKCHVSFFCPFLN